jgi:hypothetical protein
MQLRGPRPTRKLVMKMMKMRDIGQWIPTASLLALPGAQRLWKRFPLGPVHERTRYDIWDRPAYAYGVYSAASLAKQLGMSRMAAIEFGVAQGEGLVALERVCADVGAALDISISAFGFDTGHGNPKPLDYRDLPYLWDEGYYEMDEAKLRSRLSGAKLILGDVAETVDDFISALPDPIGFVSFDLDYYSSTVQAFRIFEGRQSTRLPRILCYFDDILWPDRACYSDYTGEYLAINEFNETHARRKIAQIPHLHRMRRFPADWNEQMYAFHDFDHADYCTNIRRSVPLTRGEMSI